MNKHTNGPWETRGLTVWEPGKTALSIATVTQHHPDAKANARLIAAAPTLAAENAALKALVAEIANEAALWRQLIIAQASFVSVGDVESSPLIEDMDALITRAKEAAS